MRALLLLLTSLSFLTACKPEEVKVELSGETMGTTYNIIAVDKTGEVDQAEVHAAVEATLKAVNAAMSNWDPNSEISKFNASESTDPIEISPEMYKVMAAANDVHSASLGQFDVTLGPLIEIWGFGARTSESPIPADADIAARLEIVGQTKVLNLSKTPLTLQKTTTDASVYLAAIAKGYGVDEVAATLGFFGLEDYMVEIGGDLVTSGTNAEGDPWNIGVEKPDAAAGTIEQVVTISGLGMATSGDYRNYFEENGVHYSHIIDAETGRPITHTTASVTVLADNAMLADAWATALLALGAERGMEIAEAQNLGALFIMRDPQAAEKTFITKASSRFTALQTGK